MRVNVRVRLSAEENSSSGSSVALGWWGCHLQVHCTVGGVRGSRQGQAGAVQGRSEHVGPHSTVQMPIAVFVKVIGCSGQVADLESPRAGVHGWAEEV